MRSTLPFWEVSFPRLARRVELSLPLGRLETRRGWKTGNGGEGGIRTLGTRKGTTVFETAPFDRSGTSPHLLAEIAPAVGNPSKYDFDGNPAGAGRQGGASSRWHGPCQGGFASWLPQRRETLNRR